MKNVSFTRMEDGTAEDYRTVIEYERANHPGLADRLLAELRRAGDLQGPWQVTRYEHSLQTATRALRDSAPEEMVVAALLHDIGDGLAPVNHSQLAGAILRPYVSEETWWVVEHHGLFQGYYYFHHLGMDRDLRDQFRDHPHYEKTVQFCQDWDQPAFDPAYACEPLETFEPMVKRIFGIDPFPRFPAP
ncbi:MAG: HD domain-containing protein [Myxococcales bacterium]|nr:HD domain-containing protein [Myxococcales bacterium]